MYICIYIYIHNNKHDTTSTTITSSSSTTTTTTTTTTQSVFNLPIVVSSKLTNIVYYVKLICYKPFKHI